VEKLRYGFGIERLPNLLHQGQLKTHAAGTGLRHNGLGMVLVGGGALLRLLDERLRREMGVPVHVPDDP